MGYVRVSDISRGSRMSPCLEGKLISFCGKVTITASQKRCIEIHIIGIYGGAILQAQFYARFITKLTMRSGRLCWFDTT